MLTWLLKFLVACLVIVIIVYVCNLVLAELVMPAVARTLIMLIIAVGAVVVVARYLGWPPASGSSELP